MSRATEQPRASIDVRPSFLALSCVGAFLSAPAMARGEAPVPVPVPANDLTGDADATGGQRGDIVVNGERDRDPKQVATPLNTPRSTVSLPDTIIQQSGSSTLADALRTVPGITFGAAEGGNPVGDRPFIRGFDSQGSTYIDGVRDFSAQSREVFAIDTVQIVRGSDGSLGGRGSAGGTINIITRQPVRQDFASGAISYGSDDYKRVTVDVNRKLGDTVAVRVEGLWHDQDVAGRDALFQRRWGLAPSITVGLGTPTRLTASYYYLESHELPDSGIPYLYIAANAPLGTNLSEPAIGRVTTIGGQSGVVARTAFYGLVGRDFRDTTTNQATLRAEHDFGGITLRNTARFSHNDQAYIYTQPDDSQGNVFGTNAASAATAGGLVWRRANTRYGYADALVDQTDLFGAFTTGGIKHSFSVGAEFSWEKARRGTFVTRGLVNAGNEILSTGATLSPRCASASIARAYCASLFNPNPRDAFVNYANDTSTAPAPIARSLPIAETQNDAISQGVYGFDSITLTPWLLLNLGARLDRFSSTVTPGQPIAATSSFHLTRTDTLFNYQAGLVFKPSRRTSLYASYATSATPPNSLLGEGQEFNALGTTDTAASRALLDALRVETSTSYEVGAKADILNAQLSLTLAAFQTETDNSRVIGPDGTAQFVGRRRVRGIEFNFSGNIAKGWTVFGGYTLLDPVIVDGGFTALTVAAVGARPATTVAVPAASTGRQAPQTARGSGSLWTNLDVTRRFSVGGGIFYTSRVYGGYADDRRAVQDAAGTITVIPATRTILRSIPGYLRFDARAGYKINDSVDLSVNIQNLTDETYFSQGYQSHYATIAPGRSVFATLGFRF